jgi:O-antigen ligase
VAIVMAAHGELSRRGLVSAGLRLQGIRPTLTALVVSLAGGAAAAAALLPFSLVAATVLACLAMIGLLMARRYVRGGGEVVQGPAIAVESSAPSMSSHRTDALRVARYIYYAGMLTLGQTSVRPLQSFAVSDWIFLLALIAALAAVAMQRRSLAYRVPALVLLGVALYVISGMASTLEAVAPLVSIANVARFAYLTLVWVWLGALVLTKARHLRTAIALWAISIAIDGVAAALQAQGLILPYVGAPMSGRMTGFMEQVNHLGGAAAIVIAPALALAVTSSRLRSFLAWIGVFVVIVAAIVLSGSVAGMAAAIGAVVAWQTVSSRGLRPVAVAFAALVVAAVVIQTQGSAGLPTPAQRLLSVTGRAVQGEPSSLSARVQGYEAAWAAVGDGGWLGHGLDSSSPDPDGARSAHNVLLKAWYEGGLAAAVGWLAIVAGGLGCALVAARRAPTDGLRALAGSLFAAVLAFFIFSMSSPMLSQRYGWVSVALAISCASIVKCESAEAAVEGDFA